MQPYELARAISDLPERYNAAKDLIGTNISAGRANKTAVIDHTGAYSYGMLAGRIERMAAVLAEAGIQREQRILLCLTDTVDFPTVFLGAIHAGIIPVPLNTLLTADDYAWILRDSDAVAVIVSDELTGKWTDIAQLHSDRVHFFSSGDGPWPKLGNLLNNAASGMPVADTHRDDAAFWLYTSGSTGRPKGAMHSHASLRLTANLYGRGVVGFQEDDVVLSVAKQFFAYGLGNSLTFPFAAGATAVLNHDRATPETISALMRAHDVSILCGVPTFFAGWLGSTSLPGKAEVSRLRRALSAGEALPSHIAKAFTDHFDTDVLDGLGSTEMLHIFLSQHPGAVRYGCTGMPVPGYELRLVGDDGKEVADGDIGELQVKGVTSAIGYWRNRPKTIATFLGEWVRTGDKYVRDKDGWFTHAGRTDDMLKVGGIYVSPTEVEEVLARHTCIMECAVVGADDADGLVKPRAHVVLRPGFVASAELEAELKAHVRTLLAPYKYPRWFIFMEELPKTATGKIQRFRLRD